jgi:hypothetical protein
MVDPETTLFNVSWENWDEIREEGELISAAMIRGADAAIAWGRERADVILIRLGHTRGTYYSAGSVEPKPAERDATIPTWPPAGPPSVGWFRPYDDGLDV